MHGMKSEMELADEEFEANLAKPSATDANENEGHSPSAMREALTKIKNLADDYEQCATKAGALDCIYDLASAALSAPPEPPSNTSAMRAALLKASDALTEAAHHNLTEEYVNECLALIHAALAAPPDNAEDATKMREALESCLIFIMRLDRAFNPFMQNLLENAIAKASAALSVPPNDLLMKAEEEVQASIKAYKEICEGD